MFLKVVQNFGYKSVMKMSKIIFVFFIFSLLLSCIDFRSDETLKEEGFHQIHDFFKSEYNLILSKEDFDRYSGIKYDAQNVQWECGLLDKRDPGYSVDFIYVQDKECVVKKKNYKDEVEEYSLKRIEKYGKIFKEYFSQEKNLMKIDWYEFMKFNNITPILIFFIPDYLTKKDAEKIRNEIAKHYNKKDFIILLLGTDTYIDKNGNEVHEAFGVW